MDRRDFVLGATVAGLAASVGIPQTANLQPSIGRYRFGVNYTPSQNWWFCWNDWTRDSIRRDVDAIAALGADHLRVLLIWPFFQPNATWVSRAHIDRLGELLDIMSERSLDAVVTVFTGQLSGLYFLPPFMDAYRTSSSAFYTDIIVRKAQEVFVSTLATELIKHNNVIGFDLGNEINTLWSAESVLGDSWMHDMFTLMKTVLPDRLHVNGIDHQPWFRSTTFSPSALAAQPVPTIHCYPWWTGALKYGGAMDPPSVKLIAAMAALVRSYASDLHKPVWCEEFNTCIVALDEAGQAAWLEKAITAAIEGGVGWFTYWDSHDVNRRFQFGPMEYSLGLLTNDNRVKEQGKVFSALAKAYAGKPIVLPVTAPPAPPSVFTVDATWQWLLDWMGWKPPLR